MEFENRDIKCGIFCDAEIVIKRTDTKIKEATSIKEIQYYTQDILLEARSLLSCSKYNAENPDCLTCHSISHAYIQEYKYLASSKRREHIINR